MVSQYFSKHNTLIFATDTTQCHGLVHDIALCLWHVVLRAKDVFLLSCASPNLVEMYNLSFDELKQRLDIEVHEMVDNSLIVFVHD